MKGLHICQTDEPRETWKKWTHSKINGDDGDQGRMLNAKQDD